MTQTTKKKCDEVKLAIGLLEIAAVAMSDCYYQSDSRCRLARRVLKKHGIEFDD